MPESILEIPLDKIRPFEGQPRRYFSPDSLAKLCKSIKKRGQETPGTVRQLVKTEGSFEYELIDGERRYRACKLAGIPTFRAILCSVSSAEDQFERSIVSNFGREGHPPMEIAFAIKRLRQQYTPEEVAERVAKSTAWVYQYQSLLGLSETVQSMLNPSLPQDRQLGFSIALKIVQIPDEAIQIYAAKQIVEKKLNLRTAQLFIERLGKEKGIRVGKADRRDDCRTIERFIGRLETDSEMILNVRQIDFSAALGSKSFHQLRALIETLQGCMENITGIRDSVKSVYDGRSQKAERVALQRVG